MFNRADQETEKLYQDFGSNGHYAALGIGIGFRGRLYRDERDKDDGVELVTRYILFGFLPIVPLASYRVRRIRIPSSRRRLIQLISKEPIAWRQALPYCLGSVLVWSLVFSLLNWIVKQ